MLTLAGVFVVGFFIVYSSAVPQEETTSTPHVDSSHIKVNEIFIDGKSFLNGGKMSMNFQKDNDAFLANLLAQISDFKMDKDLLTPRYFKVSYIMTSDINKEDTTDSATVTETTPLTTSTLQSKPAIRKALNKPKTTCIKKDRGLLDLLYSSPSMKNVKDAFKSIFSFSFRK